jgi:hypothetical protein
MGLKFSPLIMITFPPKRLPSAADPDSDVIDETTILYLNSLLKRFGSLV